MENCLIWFRNDLRIQDNALINHCIKNKYKIVPLYIIDPSDDMGSASKWWLKNSLNSLNKSLNNKLLIFADDNKKVLSKLIEQHDISKIIWSERYSKNEINQDLESLKSTWNQIKDNAINSIACLLYTSDAADE